MCRKILGPEAKDGKINLNLTKNYMRTQKEWSINGKDKTAVLCI